MDTFPLTFSSFHQWGWTIFSISTWIHLWGWLMGSGSSGLGPGQDWDWAADGWAVALGLAPPVWVGQCWGPSGGGGCGESSGMAVMVPGVSSYSLAKPFTRKRVRPRSNAGLSPRFPSTLNLSCFFVFFSASVGVSCHCTLLLDSWAFVCKLSLSQSGWAAHQQDTIVGD